MVFVDQLIGNSESFTVKQQYGDETTIQPGITHMTKKGSGLTIQPWNKWYGDERLPYSHGVTGKMMKGYHTAME